MDSEDIVKFIRGKSDELECANSEIEQLRQRVVELEGELLSAAMESTQTAQVEKLEQRIAELEEQVDLQVPKIAFEQLNEKLAAAQLQNSRLRKFVEELWQIIDDIDTYGDMAKSDNKLFRSLVERRQKDRWKTGIDCDGHTLKHEALREPTDTEALEKYIKERLGEPVAWRGMTGHGAVISVNKPAIQPDNWEPLYALKDKPCAT